jgi:hypothetical protein
MQDRYYEFLYFPVSVLKKLFYAYKERQLFFDDWVNNQIDNIAVYTDETDKILFKDVKTLDITSNR